MPAATVADGAAIAHSARQVDTPSNVITGTSGDLASLLWAPNFPSPQLVSEAAALFPRAVMPAGPDGVLTEGPRPYLRVGPGIVAVRSKDHARAERRPGNEGAIERMGLGDLGQRELTIVEGELLDRVRQLHVPLEQQSRYADLLASYLKPCTDRCAVPCDLHPGELPGDPIPTRVITEWSRKSRSYMTEVLGLLDYTPMFEDPSRLPAMLTVTYPGCWLRVAPNGATVKAHLKALRKRYQRAYGEPLLCIWKLEFQRRVHKGTNIPNVCMCEHCDGLDDGRAPHVHMMMVPPHKRIDGLHFKQWLSRTWADIVAHPDPVQRSNHLRAGTAVDVDKALNNTDPRRLGVYFTKHGLAGSKEYQHRVPEAWQQPGEGPGRFWGYWALEKVTAEQQVMPWVADRVGQTIRRWSKAQGVTRQVSRPRVKGGRPVSQYPEVIGLAGAMLLASRDEPRYRKTRTRAVRMKTNRGFVSVNSGPEFASQLARYIDQILDTGVVTDRKPILPK